MSRTRGPASTPSSRCPDLARPVLLRRRAYYDILRSVLDEAGATFAELTVVGDIFELDLAMPLALGARVGLVASPRTPPYERAFVDAHPRAQMIEESRRDPGVRVSRDVSRASIPRRHSGSTAALAWKNMPSTAIARPATDCACSSRGSGTPIARATSTVAASAIADASAARRHRRRAALP